MTEKLLQGVLRNLHQFAIPESRLVRDDAADRHVKGLGNVYQRVAVQQNRLDEFAHQVTVRAAVADGALSPKVPFPVS